MLVPAILVLIIIVVVLVCVVQMGHLIVFQPRLVFVLLLVHIVVMMDMEVTQLLVDKYEKTTPSQLAEIFKSFKKEL
jgi:hypothetical protein